MALSLSSPAVLLFVLLSICALPGLALAQSGSTPGACTTLVDKKSCNKQRNCCWMGKNQPGKGLVYSCGFYDLATDPLNCGTCQKWCAWPSYPSTGNPSPCCNGTCTSFDVDSNNCGKCGNKCIGGSVCRNGACKCPSNRCWSGTRCSIVTVWDKVGNILVPNFDNNIDNCGACGNQCAMGFACCTGFSPGTCTNIAFDSSNCGKCGSQCLNNSICVKGVCKCATPCTGDTTCVNGACGCTAAGTSLCGMNKCVNKLTDVLNCGACGNQCPSGSTCCNGSCTDTAIDSKSCGSCGKQCLGETACVAGVCKCPSATNSTLCANGKCVDTRSDPTNCGSCGNLCHSGSICCNGSCTNTTTDASNCGVCGSQCPLGSSCCNGSCANTTSDANNCGICGNQCPSGSTCCNGSCTSTTSDVSNCGVCGNQCPLGSSCCNGSCANTTSDANNCGVCGNQCPSGSTCCNGTCINTTSDANNCGVCGNQCLSGSTCCNGSCTSTTSDGSNCGLCGNQCSAGLTCSNGSCVDTTNLCGNQSCALESTCCSGSCTNTTSDANNCGVCGHQCMGRTGSACVGDVQCMSCEGGGCSLYIPAAYRNYDWSTFYELPEVGLGYIQFTAQATLDVHLALSQEARTITPWYEIIIGGNQNRESQIVHIHDSGPDRADYYWGVFMDNPGGLNDLWVSIDKNSATVEAGKGVRGSANSQTIMSFVDPEFLTNISFIGFSTWTMPVTYTNMVVHTL